MKGAGWMTIYDVSYGNESRALMCLQDDGGMTWTIDPLWHDYWIDAGIQEAIEKVITADPSTTVFEYRSFTIRQCQGPPG
jgi:hypothetical protein